MTDLTVPAHAQNYNLRGMMGHGRNILDVDRGQARPGIKNRCEGGCDDCNDVLLLQRPFTVYQYLWVRWDSSSRETMENGGAGKGTAIRWVVERLLSLYSLLGSLFWLLLKFFLPVRSLGFNSDRQQTLCLLIILLYGKRTHTRMWDDHHHHRRRLVRNNICKLG